MPGLFDLRDQDADGGSIFDLRDRPKEQPKAPKAPEPKERSYPERVLKEGLPAVGSTVGSIVGGLGGAVAGVPYAAGAFIGSRGSPSAAKDAFMESVHTGAGLVPHSSDPQAQGNEQIIEEGLDAAIQAGGSGLNWISEQQAKLLGVNQGPKAKLMREAMARSAGEGLTQMAPIPGLEGAAEGLYGARMRFRGAREYDSWGRDFVPQEPPKPGQPPTTQPSLFDLSTEAGDVDASNIRSPYNLPMEERARLGAEMSGESQGDLFSGYNPVEKFSTDAGGRGFRDTQEGPDLASRGIRGTEGQFDSSLTPSEYTGPRQQGQPVDNGIPFARYNPEDVRPLMAAEAKPGFLQDAIDKINLKFDQVKNAEASHPAGQDKLAHEERASRRNRALGDLWAEDITQAVDPLPIKAEIQRAAETKILEDKHAPFTQYLPTEIVWAMRDHNRLTDPKGAKQFVEKEASVLKDGIFKPLELKYSTADGKIVLTNGNTRASLAMKHGLDEVPVRVTVTDKPLKDTEAINAVQLEKKDLPKGDAKPSDVGLKGRDPQSEKPKESPAKPLGQTKIGSKQRGGPLMDTFKFNLGPKNPAQTIEAIQRLQGTENRPLAEVVDGIKANDIKDFTATESNSYIKDALTLASQFGRQVLQARTIRVLTEGKGPVSKLVTAINQKVESIDRWQNNVINQLRLGKQYSVGTVSRITGQGIAHLKGSPDGYKATFERIRKLPDGRALFKAWLDAEGKRGDPEWKSEKHRQEGTKLRAILAQVKDIVDAERAKHGLDPVALTPNFFPHSREIGDYVMTGYDAKTQQLRYHRTFQTMRQARKAFLKVQAQFPDIQFRAPEYKKVTGNKNNLDMQALIQTRLAAKGFPELTAAVDKAIDEAIQHRGAGGHLMKRTAENIIGYKGREEAKISIDGLEDGFHAYIEHMISNAANLKRRAIQKEMEALRFPGGEPKQVMRQKEDGSVYPDKGNKLVDLAPELHHYMTNYLMSSRGALTALDQLDKAMFTEMGRALQIGEHGATRWLHGISNFATIAFLMKIPFVVSQPFQTFNNISRIMKVRQDLGAKYIPGFSEAYAGYHFLDGWLKTIFPFAMGAEGRAAVQYAVKEGYMDPKAMQIWDRASNHDPISHSFYNVTGGFEREAVRIPAVLQLEGALRDLIPDAETRYNVVASQMSRAMAITSKSDTPLLYTNMGPLGIPFKTLKSYGTNYFGQFAEHLDWAVRGVSKGELSRLAPLGAFLGTAALVGGVQGLILMQEADALITMFNVATNSNVRTPQEWIMTGGISDLLSSLGFAGMAQDVDGFLNNHPNVKNTLTFGAASTMLGHNIQAQVGNPPATSLLDIIPAKLFWTPSGGGLVEPTWNYVKAVAQGQLTDAIRMKFYEAVTFNNPHAKRIIEQSFQKPGQPVPNPNLNMGGQNYRTDAGYTDRKWWGAESIDEARANLLLNFIRRHEARLERDRSQTQNSVVDDLLNGNMSAEKLGDYFQKGGSPQSLQSDIQSTMLQRKMPQTDFMQVQGGKGKGSPQYMKKLQEMQPYTNAMPRQSLFDLREQPPLPRADGGPVVPGQDYLVGERGPETLVTPQGAIPIGQGGPQVIRPKVPGKVIPNINPARVPNLRPTQPFPPAGGVRGDMPMDNVPGQPMQRGIRSLANNQEMQYAKQLEQQANDLQVQQLMQQHPDKAESIADIYRWSQRQQMDRVLDDTMQNLLARRAKQWSM